MPSADESFTGTSITTGQEVIRNIPFSSQSRSGSLLWNWWKDFLGRAGRFYHFV